MSMPTRTPRQVIWRGLWILWLSVKEEPRIFAISAVGSALFGGMTIAQAYAFGHITGSVIEPAVKRGDATTASLTGAALLVMGVATLKIFGILGRRLGAGIMQYRLQATYRKRVTRRYLELPLEWHQQHPTGELLSNANSDVEATWYPIAPFPFAVGVVFMLVGTLTLLFFTDPVLAIVGSIIFPAIAVLTVVYSSRMSPLMTRAQQLRGEVSTIAHESFDGALVVKTLGREQLETERFTAKSRELRDTLVQVGRVRGLFDPIMEALPVIGVLLVLVVGTSRVGSGHLDSATLVRVAYLFTLLAFPVRAIGWVLNELPRSVVGYDRVLRVLDAEGKQTFGTALADASGAVSLDVRDVSFAYGDDQVLHSIGFDVAPGRTVAVVGPTGSGKSTLASLLVRLVDPLSGVVEYDGTDVSAYAPGQLATVAALAPQTTFLFDDTVRGNVTLGAEVSDEQVWAALRVAQAEGFVAALPKGLDTVVGERGTTLSGGQRQRLGRARAGARHPPRRGRDDAPAAGDPTVEPRHHAGLRGSSSASTVVVVAYRRATIALADEVVFVEDGRLVDRGTHEELRERCVGYRDLVTAYERADAERVAEHAGDEREPA